MIARFVGGPLDGRVLDFPSLLPTLDIPIPDTLSAPQLTDDESRGSIHLNRTFRCSRYRLNNGVYYLGDASFFAQ
jgi:hypothetical protein